VEEARRGPVVGRYCLSCHSVYPPHGSTHQGKPIQGRDHLGSTCPNEGYPFVAGADWWDLAVEVLPPLPPVEETPADEASAPAP
jgi:hypothetical protein